MEDLRIKMELLKIRKTHLASHLGTSKQHVNQWFHGVRKPNGEFVLKIQEWFKTKLNLL